MKYSTMRFLQAAVFAVILLLTIIWRQDVALLNRNLKCGLFIAVCVIYYLMIRRFPERKGEDRSGWNAAIDIAGGVAVWFVLTMVFDGYVAADSFLDPGLIWLFAGALLIANLRMGLQAARRERI